MSLTPAVTVWKVFEKLQLARYTVVVSVVATSLGSSIWKSLWFPVVLQRESMKILRKLI